MRLQNLRESSQSNLFSANVACVEPSLSNHTLAPESSSEIFSDQVSQFNVPPTIDSYSGRGRGGPGRGCGGRYGGRSSIIFQVCGKSGHHALICYLKFNPSYNITSNTPYNPYPNSQSSLNPIPSPGSYEPRFPSPQINTPTPTSPFQNWDPQPYDSSHVQPYNPSPQQPYTATHPQQYTPTPTATWACATPSILGLAPQH
ncbi:unnamed protein product [Cuscuta epithymum]|uniref:Uncharacterized protein n=1 Tax=Cuscuta epithymum TaxID=186058 RepID=A0AAV0D3J0_9ASTE|nr:unnamed protein product [Cuscuta epithymum]